MLKKTPEIFDGNLEQIKEMYMIEMNMYSNAYSKLEQSTQKRRVGN